MLIRVVSTQSTWGQLYLSLGTTSYLSYSSISSKMEANMTGDTALMSIMEEKYNHVFTDLRDIRVDSWLLMSSPWPTFFLCVLYYYIVRFAGPSFMADRTAYGCQKPMLVYNIFQTFFSLWIFSRLCGFWLSGKYNWICQPVDYTDSVDGVTAADIVWWYFFSKFTDFMDSFFFVLRKKNNQLTSLHVIHHAMMPMVSWIFLKFVGGDHSTFFMFLNMGVHVVMYFYYLMSSMGPAVQKYLWWKKYLTTMQLVQFVTFFLHASLPLFIPCDFPKIFSYVILFHGAMFFLLFANFYRKTYTKKSTNPKKTDINGNGAVKKD